MPIEPACTHRGITAGDPGVNTASPSGPPGGPSGPRILLRRLREVMAGSGAAQERMDQLVTVIAANMVAEVCSIYLLRDGLLELFATEGLNRGAVHQTTLRIGEGLVGGHLGLQIVGCRVRRNHIRRDRNPAHGGGRP